MSTSYSIEKHIFLFTFHVNSATFPAQSQDRCTVTVAKSADGKNARKSDPMKVIVNITPITTTTAAYIHNIDVGPL